MSIISKYAELDWVKRTIADWFMAASVAQSSCQELIVLILPAMFCLMVYGLGPKLAAFGPRLDPRLRISINES